MSEDRPGDSTAVSADLAESGPSLVVCSLEPWTEVRRRLRILVDEMVAADPALRVLFVVPAIDPLHAVRTSPRELVSALRTARMWSAGPQVRVLAPRKWAPRSLGPLAQWSLDRQVSKAVEQWGLVNPVLWINDASYASLIRRTGWPSVYDITDDWLLAPLGSRQRARLKADEETMLEHAGAVVVCSAELARSRGAHRSVDLIPNAVDVELFRVPRERPDVLPPAPTAVYVGTLHEERVDVDLLYRLATDRPGLHLTLVGPNCLPASATARLGERPNVHLVGPVPYEQVPAFLQHADVLIVPHRRTPFTESLDPIKAYECLATGRPTVATPVAGFRDLGPPVVVADGDGFVAAVGVALADGPPPGTPGARPSTIPTWHDRAHAAAAVAERVRRGDRHPREVSA